MLEGWRVRPLDPQDQSEAGCFSSDHDLQSLLKSLEPPARGWRAIAPPGCMIGEQLTDMSSDNREFKSDFL